MKLTVHVEQLIGGRENQEDCLAISCVDGEFFMNKNGNLNFRELDSALFAICDGMGGHEAGEVAAESVSKSFISAFKDHLISDGDVSEALNFACLFANQTLRDEIISNPNLDGMGTTLVGVNISQYFLNWVSVGDSHLFLFRDGKLKKLNQDHSMVPVIQAMVSQGLISESDASIHPDRNALRSVISGEEISLIDNGISNFKLFKGDIIVLATDGIDEIDSKKIKNSIKRSFWKINYNPAIQIKENIEKLNLKGNDNTTICTIIVE